jgi:serine/threonine-protein kinase PknG
MPVPDPVDAVLADPQVAEDKRFCSNCNAEVGRGRDSRAGRVTGFCSKCRQPYSFLPPLKRGDLVAGQYRVAGCLAYGGLGWIYLAQDVQLSNRWVVLKGLLNTSDPDAMSSAVAERRFLARVEHPNVVRIYNFVEHAGAGYTVMEYVGGKTLRDILMERRQSNNGLADPLRVEHAIAYLLGILPAFAYLHRMGLVYNDFKPDNVMLHGDDVRLIDLGAVTRMDDDAAAIYGTDGYQAPEVARLGPSVASDLYTIGRCLAVLIMDLRGYQTKFRYSLPDPADQPALAQHESLHRFLLKSTAENPDDRFQNADDMAEQLVGVLREVVAASEGAPRPAASHLFGGDHLAVHVSAGAAAPVVPDWSQLPRVKVNAADPAASFVVDISALSDPAQQVALVGEAVERGQIPETAEAKLGVARALIAMGELDEAERRLNEVNADDPWDWRVTWYRGLCMLCQDMPAEARATFDRVSSDLPGELAPKLAEGLAAELAGDLERAARLYHIVAGTDPSFTSACFGLARVHEHLGNRAGAVEAYRLIPETSILYTPAQVALARTLICRKGVDMPTTDDLKLAAGTIERLPLDPEQRTRLKIEILDAALALLQTRTLAPNADVQLMGHPLQQNRLKRGLEQAYRDLARLATTLDERIELVDMANRARPRTVR